MPNVDDDYERPNRTADVKRRVAAPAILLILSALLSLLISGTMLAVAITKPSAVLDWCTTNVIDAMPNGIMKEDIQKQFESQKESMMLNSPLNLSYYVITLLAGLIMLYGAWQMKTVGSYRWAVVGSLFAFLPLSGCSFLAFPFGLYAVIRLAASDVVKGFHEARKARHAL